ncbi:MAG: phosphate acetyltransferase [Myxococcaceae bacterium]|nr:phosphate acetyltransferase [Myxococcaceae bacterium]
MARTLFVAPAGRNVGLTTAALGLMRALDRQGVRVAFCKPIAVGIEDRSVALARLAAPLHPPPAPLANTVVEELLSSGEEQTLLERVVALSDRAAEGADVLVVEGMVTEGGASYASRLNALMLKALDAELVLVGAAGDQGPVPFAEDMAIAARGFGELGEGRQPACVVNMVKTDDEAQLLAWSQALLAEKLGTAAVVPFREELSALRVKDLADALGAKVLHEGEMRQRRFRDVRLCAMTVPNSVKVFAPDRLLITPADRDDIILAVALAVLGGMRIAGLVLSGDFEPNERVMQLCAPALAKGLPVLAVHDGSFQVATAVASVDRQIPLDDRERVELAMNAVADRIDQQWLKGLVTTRRARRLSPPAFRQRLVEQAKAANKRIVLPEGTEPRTIEAAAIVQERGIARCVLLGPPEEVQERARKQGVRLPPTVEIIDPASIADRYVEPLVERRKARGMTVERAQDELQDAIMVGTMMMALGEADGLVSGAVHTTAHTIRPALQLIKTVPGVDLVSSVFFMCLPEEVLVFGDCAVVPNPTAEELAQIAIQSAETAAAFGIPPRVAMLSYSTGASGGGEDVEKVVQATALAKQRRPELLLDGPLQYDAAVMADVARTKAPKSPVAGKANVIIFPDLNTGNVTYKAVQRSAGVVAMGPVLQGLNRPVNDLSRGCLVDDIVFTIAVTAIQAQQAAARRS